LESLFWTILEEIAESEGMSGKLLIKLSEEVLELHGNVHNFASLLRCSLVDLSANKAAVWHAVGLAVGQGRAGRIDRSCTTSAQDQHILSNL
jgi:predicted DNA-binding ribbon-helix-helix protein